MTLRSPLLFALFSFQCAAVGFCAAYGISAAKRGAGALVPAWIAAQIAWSALACVTAFFMFRF